MRLMVILSRVLKTSFTHFFYQHYYIRCSALTFTSLLSFVPVFSVLIAIFSKLPFVKDQLPKLQYFVLHNFLPEQGEKILDYIELFTNQAQKLPWSQFAFLIVISGALVLSVERTLNHVWGVRQQRKVWHSLLRSWSVILLSAIFMGLSLMLSSYLLAAPLFRHFNLRSLLQDHIAWWLPFIVSWIGFSFLYVVLPNTKVAVKTALVGGAVVSILFEMMKHGFAWYIHSIPTYNAIYGALAVIPLFMMWIYFFWCIVIYGALVTNQLGDFFKEKTPKLKAF